MQKINKLIVYLSLFVVIAIFLIPARFVLAMVDMPSNLDIKVNHGNMWRGHANILWTPGPTKKTDLYLLSWKICLGRSLPFIAYCWKLEGASADSSGRLVGIPADIILLERLQTELELAPIIEVFSDELDSKLLTISKLRGKAKINIRELRYNLQNNIPLSWNGEIIISQGGFFNVDFPEIKLAMTQEQFISHVEQKSAAITDTLPTIRLSASGDTMDISGDIQILPQKEIKLDLQIIAKNQLVSQTFTPIATNREGNKFFWTYQGKLTN